MEGTATICRTPERRQTLASADGGRAPPFSEQWVTITKQERIDLNWRASYWEMQHGRAKLRIADLEQDNLLKAARIKDLENRLFGKKSEKNRPLKSEKGGKDETPLKRKRGQQPGSPGHGRTQRPDLPIVEDGIDLADEKKCCRTCGLPHRRNPALDEHSDVIEVQVKAYIRRIVRPAYTRNPGCRCAHTPVIVTAPPPPRLIPRSVYGVSFWVEVILSKYRYGQPSNRHLQDLQDQGLGVSPGTLAGGLQAIAALFEPVLDALYCKQMSERIFHNDETRWEVFVEIEGKVGSRWYLWVTRSPSVIFYCIDPSRSAAVPGAHFAGLQVDQVIIVCDRYSAYKKLARLALNILLAFCWAHVRRDFLDAGRSFAELEAWALQWKERIATLYHLNRLRLEQWDPERALTEQSNAFAQHQDALQAALEDLHAEATRVVGETDAGAADGTLSRSARTKRKKVLESLLEHWPGLIVFVANPAVPMDNNLAENTIRTPVNGRKNYYGSGSIWSAELAAMLFSILQTLVLWDINPRHWLTDYLRACAENGGRAPRTLDPFLPWSMEEARRAALTRPAPSPAPEPPAIRDSS